MLADWGKDKRFVYGGREGKSTALVTSGECAMHIASSGSASAIEAALGKDKVGIAMMPYSPEVKAEPQNSIIGGAPCGCCRAGRRTNTKASRSS